MGWIFDAWQDILITEFNTASEQVLNHLPVTSGFKPFPQWCTLLHSTVMTTMLHYFVLGILWQNMLNTL